MTSPTGAHGSPDDVPHLRLPTEELTQLVQVAAMLVAALRQRRTALGAEAWHPHEDAARRHERATNPDLRRPNEHDQAQRWAAAAARQWGEDAPAADPAFWHDTTTDPARSTPLWQQGLTVEHRGWSPEEVLAGLSPPTSAAELAEQLRTVPDPRQVAADERVRVYQEPGADGRLVLTRWEAEAGNGWPAFTQVCARDAEIAERALHTLQHGSEQDRTRLDHACQVGDQLMAGATAPVGTLVDADTLGAAIETVTGQDIAARIRDCPAWHTLHVRVEEHLAAGAALDTVVAPLAGMEVSSARRPAAVAASRIQTAEHTAAEAARVAAQLDPQQQPGRDPAASPSSVDAGLLAQAAELVTGQQWGSTRMLARRLGLDSDVAAGLMDELERHNIVGPADPQGRARQVLVTPYELPSVLGTTPAAGPTEATRMASSPTATTAPASAPHRSAHQPAGQDQTRPTQTP